jgi:phosphonate transport system substrate-binding protein
MTIRSMLPFCGSLLTAALLLVSCTSSDNPQSNTSQAANPGWPARIRMAYTPSSEDAEARFNYNKEIAAYLADYIGVPVDLFETSSYGPSIEAMRAKKIDVASMGPFAYMIAAEKANAEAIIGWGFRTEDGWKPGLYTSIIVVPPDSPIQSMQDLVANSKKLVFAFNDAASASGHLVPRGGLQDAGIVPERDFRRVVFAQSHLNTIMTVASGKVDAGAIQESAFVRLIEKGRMKPEELKIIWRSEPIQRSPMVVRRDLPRDLIEKIRDAFLEMETREPELFQKRFAVLGTAYEEGLTWVPVFDHQWDSLRKVARSLEGMRLIEGKDTGIEWNEEMRQLFGQDTLASQ